jgi:uncharacterized membrane protein
MTYLIWVLRIAHILGGIFWVGGALIMNFYIGPSVGATADAGRTFVGHLMGKTNFSKLMMAAAFTSVTAGAIMYWNDSSGFTSPWMKSGAGTGFTIGAVFALIGLVCGIMVGRNSAALAQLGAQINGAPTSEQTQKIQAIQKQQAIVGPLNAYSLLLAVLFMSIARYFTF